MMRLISLCSILSMSLVAPALFAEPAAKPSPAEVKKVMAYFNAGKGQGPILLEFVPCLKIGKAEGQKKKSCLEPAGDRVEKKTVINIWTRWMVPKDDKYEDVDVVFIHEGKIRATKTMKVKTGYSYGTWTAKGLYKTGKWEIHITRGDEVLAKANLTVGD